MTATRRNRPAHAALAMLTLLLCFAPLARAAGPFTLPIPLRTTFLHTSSPDTVAFGTAHALAALGIKPGDRLRIETVGIANFCPEASCAFVNPAIVAAFTSGAAPAANTTLATGLPDADTPRSYFDNADTRIPGVFYAGGAGTNVTVPAGATTLWLAFADSVYQDNSGSLSAIVTVNAAPPVFQLNVVSNITPQVANASARLFPRTGDAGRTVSTYVFFMAPAAVVKGSLAKDTPVQCVLAQMNAAGQLQAVGSASDLQAAITGVLDAQGQALRIFDNVATPSVAGSTAFVGYGSSAQDMIEQGVNRSALTVPGGDTICKPAPPVTGWWWNPAEDGRGFSVEVRGNSLFFAAFLYDISGRSTWNVASGPVSLDGSLFTNRLYSASGGQTLGGAYPGRPTLVDVGAITLAFHTATEGTLVWPGGSVPIQRLPFVPNGLTGSNPPTTPENGWWWNESESGRGFFLEWQNGSLDIAGYMYDDAGNSVWYLTVGTMTTPGGSAFTGSWWSFANGQTLTGAWKPNTRTSTTVAPLSITFSGPDTALMTLPNGRTTAITRHRF